MTKGAWQREGGKRVTRKTFAVVADEARKLAASYGVTCYVDTVRQQSTMLGGRHV